MNLRTGRIAFRLWTDADLPLAVALWGDQSVTRLIADLGNPSPDQAHERLTRELANWAAHGVQYWPMFLHSGEFLGCCGLRPHQAGTLEVGAHLLPEYWGHGYATEALLGVVGYAFETQNATALFARHHPRNHGSARVLTKLGFRHTHDEFMTQTGLHHPCYLLRAGELASERPPGHCED